MSNCVLGIDPMDNGAFALISRDGTICAVRDMPTIKIGNRQEVDVSRILDIIRAANPSVIFIEKMQPLPIKMGGGIANFKRGGYCYLFRGICAAMSIPLVEVPPREWQKEFHFGTKDTKNQSYLIASRMWPDAPLDNCAKNGKKVLDGRADACLIAEYGRRRTMNAGPQ